MKIIAVIVTYNRLNELKKCISYLENQKLKLNKILIIDNNSSDGTKEYLKSNKIDFIHSNKNTGSAGGWNLGINYALVNKYDFVWMMDDDGYPHNNALNNLINYIKTKKKIICISSLVIDSKYNNRLAIPLPILNKRKFPLLLGSKRKIYFSNDKILTKHKVYDWANFFNGALIRLDAVKKIGPINTDFFLYGEEVDYFHRLRKVGQVLTLNSAIHYHPHISKPWTIIKIYFYIKNSIYLNYRYCDFPLIRSLSNILIIFVRVFKNNGTFFFLKLFLFKNIKIILKAIIRGFNSEICNDFKK
tara:strand:- start:1423 stop:2328 length:906 start_codon:yes stop_codon:yes gene_type:complete